MRIGFGLGPFYVSQRIGGRSRRRRRSSDPSGRLVVMGCAVVLLGLVWPVVLLPHPAGEIAESVWLVLLAGSGVAWLRYRRRDLSQRRPATEAEKVRIRQAVRHAIEQADQDAFELAMATHVDLASGKLGASNLGRIGGIRLLQPGEREAMDGQLDVIRECLGRPSKLATTQAAANQYNLLANKVNRRIDMLIRLDSAGVSESDKVKRIELS